MSEKVVSLRFNVPSFKSELLSVNWKHSIAKNENFSIYNGIYEGLGPVSVIPIYNLEKNIEFFPTLTFQINKWKECKSPFIAKLYGIIPERSKFCLVFERLANSLSESIASRSIDNKDKFSVLLDIMEILAWFYPLKERILDLRMNNIFLNERGDIRMVFPMEGIHLYKELNEDDEEAIIENLLNSEDHFLRFTAPELLQEPQVIGIVNDVWMLGCLFIEMFSKYKVWEGYSEGEILKQLKSQISPKVPNDVMPECWGLICECLNPFPKARINIKDVLIRFYYLLGKLGLPDMQERMQNIQSLNGLLPNNMNNSQLTNTTVMNDDPFAVRKCHLHPRQIVDLYCLKCNELICYKCQNTAHQDHNQENIIIDIDQYIGDSVERFKEFRTKYNQFLHKTTTNFPIDDSIVEFISKQKNIIDVLYEDHKKYINNQFEIFYKRIESLRELELSNLNNFRDFFLGKFLDLETKVNEIVEEKSNVDEFLENRITDLEDFPQLDQFAKESCVLRINPDINNLKTKKHTIMSLFKEYQNHIGYADKIKRYFQRSVLNMKENKAYELIKVLEKLQSQLETKYKNVDLQDLLNSMMIELDEYALINSRNIAPKNHKELYIACFNSKMVLSYNTGNNTQNMIEANFNNTNLTNFLNFSRSINVNGMLYVNGGFNESKKISLKNHLSFDPKTNQVFEEEDMIYGHSAHSLLYVPPQYIYCISGSGIGKCEKYDINAKTWVEIPELNYHRQNASLLYHNEEYLYVFGGLCYDEKLSDFYILETVERLDIGFGPVEESKRWEIIPTKKTNELVNISKSVMTIIPITSNRILLVGGMNIDQSYSDEVLMFDFEDYEFSLLPELKLEKQACFPNKSFLFFGDYAYQFDNEGFIHEFSVKDLAFKIVKADKKAQYIPVI